MNEPEFDDLSDEAVMHETVTAVTEAVCTTIDRAWRLSPSATLIALTRVLAFLALEHVQKHPDRRAVTLSALRSIGEFVEVESGTKQ